MEHFQFEPAEELGRRKGTCHLMETFVQLVYMRLGLPAGSDESGSTRQDENHGKF
jgi:hypothetical protein